MLLVDRTGSMATMNGKNGNSRLGTAKMSAINYLGTSQNKEAHPDPGNPHYMWDESFALRKFNTSGPPPPQYESYWYAAPTLRNAGNQVIAGVDPQTLDLVDGEITYEQGAFYRLRLKNPPAGVVSLTAFHNETPVRAYLTVGIINSSVQAAVQASPTLVPHGGSVTVTPVLQYNDWDLDMNYASCTGELFGPAGFSAPFTLVNTPARIDVGDPPQAVLSSFNGRGAYRVEVTCEIGGDITSSSHISMSVPTFVRSEIAYFFLDTTMMPTPDPNSDDQDGDGILDIDETSVDHDNDGYTALWDTDDDEDDVTDGVDPDSANDRIPGSGKCTLDSNPPVITTTDMTIGRCVQAPLAETLSVSVTDDSCPDVTAVEFIGRLLSVNGVPVTHAVEFSGHSPEVVLPIGVSEIEWTAVDVNNNVSSAIQMVTIVDESNTTSCCRSGQTSIVGNFFSNLFIYPFNKRYCIFGRDGADVIATGLGDDFLSGGPDADVITSGFSNDICVGGGNDLITLPVGEGFAFGGPGHDIIEATGGGVIYGNEGADTIITISGDNTIVPGPGIDAVEAGPGNDIIYILNECEALALEILDGGLGYDTLYTPLSIAELIARGVTVLNIENVVITDEYAHLSECF